MFIIQEYSYNSENPIYQRIPTTDKHRSMFVPESRVAKDYYLTGFYERAFVDWTCENFLDKNKNVIDIGAHIGWYAIDMAKNAKHVYAFECSPKSFNYLCSNIALNELDYSISKFNCALSNTNNSVPYYIRDPKDGGGNGISKFDYDTVNEVPSILVPCKPLDDFQLENINFIKMDVEGHEKQVLEGAIQTIVANDYPKILFESWDDNKPNLPVQELKQELFDYIKSTFEYKIIRIGQDMYLAER